MAADLAFDTPLVLREQAAPATPSAGQHKLYVDANGDFHSKDDGGVDQNFGAYSKGFVNHGAVAGTARPAGFASVEWSGSVAPTNMIAGDTWVNTT